MEVLGLVGVVGLQTEVSGLVCCMGPTCVTKQTLVLSTRQSCLEFSHGVYRNLCGR